MNYVTLENGLQIPQLGLGVFQTPSGEETINSVTYALNAGYRHIDAAWIYENEQDVGKAISAHNVDRKDIFITTKLWNEDIRQRRARAAFETSIKNLETDYVDLYLIHWPADGFKEAWKEMEKIYKEGRAKAIGVSNFHVHHFEELMEVAEIKPMVNQIESNPYFNNQELIDYCQKNGITVEVYSPLGGTGKSQLSDPLLIELSEKYGKSPAQIVIRWHIQRGLVVMPKSTHEERIIANFDVFDFEMSDEDIAKINGLNRGTRSGADPDNFNF